MSSSSQRLLENIRSMSRLLSCMSSDGVTRVAWALSTCCNRKYSRTEKTRFLRTVTERCSIGSGSVSKQSSWIPVPSGQGLSRTVSRMMSVETSEASCEAVKPFKPFSSIPGPSGLRALPYIGPRFMFKPFGKYKFPDDMGLMFASLHDVYGPVVRMRVSKDWVVVVSELSDVEAVLKTKEVNPFRDPLQLVLKYEQRRGKAFPVLPTRNNEEWRRLRSPMNTKLNRPDSLDLYIPAQEQAAADFSSRLYNIKNSPEIMQNEFFRFAAESVGVVCYNRRLGFLDDDAITNANKQILLTSLQTAVTCVVDVLFGKRVMCLFIEDSFYKKFHDAMDLVISSSERYIAEALGELQKKEREGTLDPNEPNFLLSMLAEKSLDENDILGIVVTLMVAGTDSVASSLQLMLYALAVNPDKQEELYREIVQVIGPSGNVTAKALTRMSYLKAAVNESLRLYFPNVIGVRRNIPSDLVLGGYQVPKGTTVIICSPRDRYYHRAKEYLPERWLRDNSGAREHPIHSLAFLPFGFGARSCIGRRFAEQELYVATVKVLQRYHVSVADNYGEMETLFAPFRTPKRPVPYIFQKRHT